MSMIIGAKVTEHKKIVGDDGQEREINKVEFRCITRESANDCVGKNVARYSCAIDELRSVFEKDPRDYAGVMGFCESMLNRECILETKASSFAGVLSERLIHVTFLDEYIGTVAKK